MGGARFLIVGPVTPVAQGTWRASPDAGGAAWRLLGANNRELGRSRAVFATAEAARAAIQQLRGALDSAVPAVQRTSGEGWTWCLNDVSGAGPLACSSRAYVRHRECVYALSAFRGAAAVAPVVSSPVLT